MEISKELFESVIIFNDKSKKFISNKQAEAIMQLSSTPARGTQINGIFITFGSIFKILPIKDFYEQYPDEIPVKRDIFEPSAFSGYKTIEDMGLASESRRKDMISGMQQFISQSESRGENPIHAKALLKKWKSIKVKT